ncbi:bacteriocin immunity protein [Vibrio brasiliensis]
MEHPSGSDLITPPTMLGIEDSSEAVIQELKRWYENKGIQCFKG